MNSADNINNIKGDLILIESKINYLAEIKSAFVLKKILINMSHYIKFEIIKYNKNLQNKLNINIDEYKKYSTIGIELIPSKNKYGKFININNNEEEKYFHIYFNNSKKEIGRNYILQNEKINKIKIIIDFQVKSFYKLFSYCDCIESISFINFYRKNINNMSFMFYECKSLKKINFSIYNTINVENMSCMFYECSLLKELDLSNFNTDNVTDMSNMFYQCNKLEKLDMTNFNTENVKNMKEMFFGCSSLREINITKFNTESLKNHDNMFKKGSDELIEKFKLLDKYSKLFDKRHNYWDDFDFLN